MTKRKRETGAALIEAAEEALAFAKGEPTNVRLVRPIAPPAAPQPTAAGRAGATPRRDRPTK